MPGFKPAAKSGKAKPGKAGGAAPAKPGGCGTGAGGFKPGNTCGHKSNRNATVEAARAAHSKAKAEVGNHLKAHRKAVKAAAKAGGAAPAPKELHAAVKAAAKAHGELKAARDTHRENQRVGRNAARRDARKAAKSTPPTPAHTGLGSSQAKPAPTDKGPRNERLALLAHRHEARSRALAARASDASRATANRLTLAGKANTHIEGKAGDDAFAGSAALNGRSALHLGVANRLREAIHDPAKSAAAGRTLKSLGNNERGSAANRTAIRTMGQRLTHAELKAAAGHAGIEHGTTTKAGLVEHLAANVGKVPEVVAPKGSSLREQAAAHRETRGTSEQRSSLATLSRQSYRKGIEIGATKDPRNSGGINRTVISHAKQVARASHSSHEVIRGNIRDSAERRGRLAGEKIAEKAARLGFYPSQNGSGFYNRTTKEKATLADIMGRLKRRN